jgi:hypothetical protein
MLPGNAVDGAVYVILLVARVRPCTYHPKITGGDDEQKFHQRMTLDGRVGGRLL